MAPYRAILRYYRCDAPYCAILFEGGLHPPKIREVPNGVGADGVGVKFPIFPVNCSRLPLFQENRQKNEEKKNEEKRKKKKKKTKKNEEKRKKWENSSDPIYTNPIKNLPNYMVRQCFSSQFALHGLRTLENSLAVIPHFATVSLENFNLCLISFNF